MRTHTPRVTRDRSESRRQLDNIGCFDEIPDFTAVRQSFLFFFSIIILDSMVYKNKCVFCVLQMFRLTAYYSVCVFCVGRI